MDDDEVLRVARAMGLTRLEPEHLMQLAQSLEAARRLGQQLPGDLHWSEEPAMVFRVAPPDPERAS